MSLVFGCFAVVCKNYVRIQELTNCASVSLSSSVIGTFVLQDDSKAILAPGTGFKFGSTTGTTEAGGFKFGTPPGGFKFGAPQKADDTPTAESSSSSAGFKFSFGTPTTTKASAVSSGFSFSGSKPTTSAAQPSGFQFGKPQTAAASAEKKPESSSALLEQLLTSDDPPETTQRSIFGATSPGGAFVSTADGSKPSGFQAKLGQVTSPVTSEAGKEKAGFQFTFNLQKQQQSQQQQPASPRSPEVDEHGFYLNRVMLLLPSLSSFSFSLLPHSTSTALHQEHFSPLL